MVSETPKNSTKFLDDIVLALALILIVLGAGMAYTVISAERAKAKDRKQATEASDAADQRPTTTLGEKACSRKD